MAHKPKTALPGQRYGRLVVVRDLPSVPGKRRVECICDCGNIHITFAYNIQHGIQSCGCLYWDRSRKHGEGGNGKETPEYRCWVEIRRRCENPNCRGFRNYGGRGISICERWNDYQNFLTDMGRKPGPEYSINRIDNDGNYEPSNCKWSTAKDQASNRRPPYNLAEKSLAHSQRMSGAGNPMFGKKRAKMRKEEAVA